MGVVVTWAKRKPNFRRGEADFGRLARGRKSGWLAAQEAVKRGAATARKRVEAAKMGVKKRVNSLAKYAASRANIVMALGVVGDGLRRV